MFDFTKHVKLPPQWHKKYLLAKTAVYIFFGAGALLALHSVIFPSFSADYFFSVAQAKKSSLVNPPRDAQGSPLKNDKLQDGGQFEFNVSRLGKFSDAELSFNLKPDSAAITTSRIIARKAYSALFYPLAEPVGFKEGSLLTNDNIFYLISENKLRRFASLELMQKMGFLPNMFTPATDADLALTPGGADITTPTYPDSTLFKVENSYYQLNGAKLAAFVSEQAFLSNYDSFQAIPKTAELLTQYPLAEDLLGFADGTLVSSPQSVFVLSGANSYPIDSTITFEALGYTWNDVIPASSDEIGLYAKQKVFDINAIHPNGTIFFDPTQKTYLLVRDGQLHSLPSAAIVKSYLKKNPVLANYTDLEIKPACQLTKQIWPRRTYTCKLDITQLEKLLGNNYRFDVTLGNDVNLQALHVTLTKSIGSDNLRDSLSHLKQQLMQNYGVTQTQ